jgi:endonuclease III
MKNATKHAETLKSLLKKLTKDHKPEPRQVQEPLKALVRGAMSYDVPDGRAEDAMRAIEKEFVDLNELRVATDLEIQELLGVRYPDIERRVAMITGSLNRIFEREHTLSLDRLKTISKRDARQFLRELPDAQPFVEAYVMLFAFDGHAFPVDEQTIEVLRGAGVIEDETTADEVQRFVEHHLKAEECFDLYAASRKAIGEGDGKVRKKKG